MITEVRGHSAYDQAAGFSLQVAAWCADLALLVCSWFLVVGSLRAFPVPETGTSAAVILGFLATRFGFQCFLDSSPGQRIWHLRLLRPDKHRPDGIGERVTARVFQSERLAGTKLAIPAGLTAALVAAAFFLSVNTISNHPLLMAAGELNLTEFAPEKEAASQWTVMPFYYSNGAWPLRFSGKPVFFTLPYEKGPPSKFLGHIHARWEMPEISLTFAGPRTPLHVVPRETLKACFKKTGTCAAERRDSLLKHVDEMKALGLRKWRVQWLQVNNPHLPEEDRPQGIWISAENKTRAQDRVILINARGTQQAFTLDRPAGAQGQEARQVFEQALRSQRVTTELDVGRAWIDRQLGEVRLDGIPKPQTAADVEKYVLEVAEAQALLLSKISVDPKTLATWFHLGGTAYLLARQAFTMKNPEWSAAAKPVVENSLRYARDISPDHVMTRKLEALWVEVKNQ